MENSITRLFNIRIPIIQGGMIWCSGWKLASAVSRAGGLGLIGAGSMSPDVFREHIKKCRKACTSPFGVNVPLLYPGNDKIIEIIVEEGVKIVFTSAGNPAVWTHYLKSHGIKVAHVVSSLKFARKAAKAGVDAVVAEGFEAGGHNGKEETTTFCLIPMISEEIDLPLISAGGIGDGRTMSAAIALGADGVQIGTRFAASLESSAHPAYKNFILNAGEGDTELVLKTLHPVRLLKNTFYNEIKDEELKGATAQELEEKLGKGRSRSGIFEGDLENGELEAGQVSAMIREVKPAGDIVREIWSSFLKHRSAYLERTKSWDKEIK